jgi:hypothetical protein
MDQWVAFFHTSAVRGCANNEVALGTRVRGVRHRRVCAVRRADNVTRIHQTGHTHCKRWGVVRGSSVGCNAFRNRVATVPHTCAVQGSRCREVTRTACVVCFDHGCVDAWSRTPDVAWVHEPIHACCRKPVFSSCMLPRFCMTRPFFTLACGLAVHTRAVHRRRGHVVPSVACIVPNDFLPRPSKAACGLLRLHQALDACCIHEARVSM